jgi:uncharacterized protein (TIGR02246 family)
MRALSFSVALMCAASSSALAATTAKTCARGEDTRIIEVAVPGQIGKACDLIVTKDKGSNRSTPYHANNGAAFCEARAEEIISGLAREGFSCVATPAPAKSEEAAATPVAGPAEIAEAPTADQMEALIAKSTAPDQVAAAAPSPVVPSPPIAATPEPLQPASTEAVALAPSIATAPMAPVASPDPAPAATHVIEQPPAVAAEPRPVQQVASAGPVALSPINASAALKGVRAPRSAAGRFVGAAGDAKPLDAARNEEVEERLGGTTPVALPVPAPVQAQAVVAEPTAAPTNAAAPKARAAEDIIKSVLAAQTAAWNEGDLEAFMGVYWKDPELKFVSGSTVAKGWKETMNRYRTLYGEGSAMGRMTLDGLDVDLVTDDVATVVGRYRVARADATDVGVFTLVMKRFDGLWRIVHDHSAPEAPKTN